MDRLLLDLSIQFQVQKSLGEFPVKDIRHILPIISTDTGPDQLSPLILAPLAESVRTKVYDMIRGVPLPDNIIQYVSSWGISTAKGVPMQLIFINAPFFKHLHIDIEKSSEKSADVYFEPHLQSEAVALKVLDRVWNHYTNLSYPFANSYNLHLPSSHEDHGTSYEDWVTLMNMLHGKGDLFGGKANIMKYIHEYILQYVQVSTPHILNPGCGAP